MKSLISPSLMCADALNLQSEIEVLDKLGVEYIHLDFMDNHFVPNITLSADLIKAVKSVLVNMKRDIQLAAGGRFGIDHANVFRTIFFLIQGLCQHGAVVASAQRTG
mgnify:CR=1 FL=1